MTPEQERSPVFTTYDADPKLRAQEAEAAEGEEPEDDGSDADEGE